MGAEHNNLEAEQNEAGQSILEAEQNEAGQSILEAEQINMKAGQNKLDKEKAADAVKEVHPVREMARCGLDCGNCDWRERCSCPGCQAAMGHMFHGECEVALCSIGKGLDHCGQCTDFPCEILNRFAFDKEHGDPEGSRIQVLRHAAART